MWLSEKETLEVSSAIVDAYINEGSYIYATVYIEPELQSAAVTTYPVNHFVMELIQNNPNIVDEARTVLTATARDALEQHLVGVVTCNIAEEVPEFEEVGEIETTDEDLPITDEMESSDNSNEEVISSDVFFD